MSTLQTVGIKPSLIPHSFKNRRPPQLVIDHLSERRRSFAQRTTTPPRHKPTIVVLPLCRRKRPPATMLVMEPLLLLMWTWMKCSISLFIKPLQCEPCMECAVRQKILCMWH